MAGENLSSFNSKDRDSKYPQSEALDYFGAANNQLDAAFELGEADPEVVNRVIEEARRQSKGTNCLDR